MYSGGKINATVTWKRENKKIKKWSGSFVLIQTKGSKCEIKKVDMMNITKETLRKKVLIHFSQPEKAQ